MRRPMIAKPARSGNSSIAKHGCADTNGKLKVARADAAWLAADVTAVKPASEAKDALNSHQGGRHPAA